MKKLLCTILAALLMLSIAACSSTAPNDNAQDPADNPAGPTTPGNDTADNDTAESKTITIAQPSEATCLWFADQAGATDRMNTIPVYETILIINEEGLPEPYLCETFEADSAAMTYTFTLKKGITFSDGSELNAESASWCLNFFKDNARQKSSYCSNVAAITALDDYTVQISMSNWDTTIPYTLTRQFGYMQSKLAYDTYGEEYCRTHPVGTGPFVLEDWTLDVSKHYVRNENYWNGEVRLDSIDILIRSDALVNQASLLSGDIDVVYCAPYSLCDTFRNEKGFSVQRPPQTNTGCIIVFGSDVEGSPLSDVRVRQAISYAIDSEAINEAVYFGYGKVLNQFVDPESPFYNDNVNGYEHNVEKAKELLADAGYPDGFSTTLYAKMSVFSDIAPALQACLAEAGIDLKLELEEDAIYNSSHVFDIDEGMVIHTMWSQPGPITSYVTNLSFQALEGNGVLHKDMLHPEDLNDLIVKSATAASEEESLDAYKQASKLIFDEYCLWYPVVSTPGIDGCYILNNAVQGGDFDQETMNWVDLYKVS